MCKMLLLLVATAHFTGCVAIVAGVGGAAIGGTAYAMGDLAVLVDASPEHLERAIKQGGEIWICSIYMDRAMRVPGATYFGIRMIKKSP